MKSKSVSCNISFKMKMKTEEQSVYLHKMLKVSLKKKKIQPKKENPLHPLLISKFSL